PRAGCDAGAGLRGPARVRAARPAGAAGRVAARHRRAPAGRGPGGDGAAGAPARGELVAYGVVRSGELEDGAAGVHVERGAVDVSGAWRGEEADGLGELARLGRPGDAEGAGDGLVALIAVGGHHPFGAHRAGGDAVDAYAAVA